MREEEWEEGCGDRRENVREWGSRGGEGWEEG
jgi:hypothetical protein